MFGPVRLPKDFDWSKLEITCDPSKTMPQAVANAMADEAQRAVEWFHNQEDVYLGDPTVHSISDEEVRERIAGWQAEYDKEVNRYNRGQSEESKLAYYVLADLPFERQRSLVERWERIWIDWMASNPEWVYDSEAGLVNKKYGYTGGPDGLAYLDGLKTLYTQADDYDSYGVA